jgi:hypothetical protein
MMTSSRRGVARALLGLALLVTMAGGFHRLEALQEQRSDLDEFMAAVLARRDENWRKLQQYILEEHETADFFGPGKTRLFGLDREYSWFIRDGVFVRSPVRFDGVALSDKERRDAEQEWIAEHKERDRQTDAALPSPPPGAPSAADGGHEKAADVESLLKLTREPAFVSSAYFMRFHFEPGRYGFVGPELYDGIKVLRIEYYPKRLFKDDHDAAAAPEKNADDARIERQMNKVALVTLWIEPASHQIVQYRFDNVGFDFLPGRSIVRVTGFGATMRMSQAFPGVWLPKDIDASGAFTLASGRYDAHYVTAYRKYREAAVGVRLR